MSRRKQRTGGIGLFVFAPDGDIDPDEIRDNPLRRECPYCEARPGERCTRRTRNGRRPNRTTHPARSETQP